MFLPVTRAGMLEVRRKRESWRRELTEATAQHLSDIITNTTGTAAFNNIAMVRELRADWREEMLCPVDRVLIVHCEPGPYLTFRSGRQRRQELRNKTGIF